MLVAAVQTNLFWENSKKNFAHIEQLLKHTNNIDLIVLPEMFPSGFSMNPISISEPENGPTLKWMQALSREKKAVVVGSVAIRDAFLVLWRSTKLCFQKIFYSKCSHSQRCITFSANFPA